MSAPVQLGPPPQGDGPVPSSARYLTPRLIEVLQLAADGYSNKRIGVALGTTEHTVKSQMATIRRRLRAEDRTQAVTVGIRLGLVSLTAAKLPRPFKEPPPTLDQLLILVARAERKGGLDYVEGSRMREGLRHLAARATEVLDEPSVAEDPAFTELRRKYDNARKDVWRWKRRAAQGGGADEEARDALRRVTELAKRWAHIPAKRQAGRSVLAAISNRDRP